METSSGFWKNYYAKLTIVNEDGFWRIDFIQADTELNVYLGDYAGTEFL